MPLIDNRLALRPEEVSDSYLLVDARFGYRWRDWSAFVYARNLLDEDYLSRRRIDGFNNAGEPRTAGVTLTYRFF
ncbi:MAG: hypothetical protein AAGM22_09380 [Acidobacteriota bacterium]